MDNFSSKERSEIMRMVKSNENKSTELRLLKIFKQNNIKGWRRKYPVIGKPDFVFLKYKLAIFVDGCFWHGCNLHCRLPKANSEYWQNKIRRNIKRDLFVNMLFQKRGWNVIRIWEHEIKNLDYDKTNIIKIINYIRQR